MSKDKVEKLDEYQDKAMQYALYSTAFYPFMALAEEAGEVAGKVAKIMRKYGNNPHFLDYDAEAIAKELGDCLWQIAACAAELDMDLSEIAEMNLKKLKKRAEKGTIIGEGDER